MLGRKTLDTSKTSSSILNSIKNTVQKEVNEAISDVAKTLNIHDFYSAHLLDYCEVRPMIFRLGLRRKTYVDSAMKQGYFTPTPFQNLTSQPSKNITHCSNETSFFHFDPGAIIQNELKPGINLTDLSWPSAIQDGVRAVEGATDLMFVLYFMGAATTGVALIAALVGVREVWRYSAVICFMLSSVSHQQVLRDVHGLANYVVANVIARFWLPSSCFIHRDYRHQ